MRGDPGGCDRTEAVRCGDPDTAQNYSGECPGVGSYRCGERAQLIRRVSRGICHPAACGTMMECYVGFCDAARLSATHVFVSVAAIRRDCFLWEREAHEAAFFRHEASSASLGVTHGTTASASCTQCPRRGTGADQPTGCGVVSRAWDVVAKLMRLIGSSRQ